MKITEEQLIEIRERIDKCIDPENYFSDEVEELFNLILDIFGTAEQIDHKVY